MALVKIATALWPFLVELYKEHKENKSCDPNYKSVNKSINLRVKILATILIITVIAFFYYDGSTNLLFQTNYQYRELSKEYTILENSYRRVIDDRNRISNELMDISRAISNLEIEIKKLTDSKNDLLKQNSVLSEELKQCRFTKTEYAESVASCDIRVPQRSRVLDYFRDLN